MSMESVAAVVHDSQVAPSVAGAAAFKAIASGRGAAQWPTPLPLEGVKSRKKPIFQVVDAELPGTNGSRARKVSGLQLCLTSRVAAIGEAGLAGVRLLLGEAAPCEGSLYRHDSLRVARLGPQSLAACRGGYGEAIEAALQERPQVVVLEESLGQKDREWAAAFRATLCSEALASFRGAVVVAVADETHSLAALCTESWVAAGSRLQQESYLEIIEHALEADSGAEDLLDEALAIDYCQLRHWVDIARAEDQQITLFSSVGQDGKKSLRGFLCHHMKENQAEFHIRFVFVPKPYRGTGLGARVVQWAVSKANRMPQSECRWISLKAADDSLVPWYEKFGFCDMTCGQCDDEDEVWMELKNSSTNADDEE